MQRIAILRQPDLDWPVIVAVDAVPGATVARHWPDYPEVTGLSVDGVPLLAVNEQGVFAAVIPTRPRAAEAEFTFLSSRGLTTGSSPDRTASLDPAIKSRDDVFGLRDPLELVLDMLDYPDAADAARALGDLDPLAYGLFTLTIGDNRDCYIVGNWQLDTMGIDPLPQGCTTLGSDAWSLPEGLQPGSGEWHTGGKICLAVANIAFFGAHPVWSKSETGKAS